MVPALRKSRQKTIRKLKAFRVKVLEVFFIGYKMENLTDAVDASTDASLAKQEYIDICQQTQGFFGGNK